MLKMAKQSCVKPAGMGFAKIQHFTKDARLADQARLAVTYRAGLQRVPRGVKPAGIS
jgi:hypothetical protein